VCPRVIHAGETRMNGVGRADGGTPDPRTPKRVSRAAATARASTRTKRLENYSTRRRLVPTVKTMSPASRTRWAVERFKRHRREVSTAIAILVSTAGIVGCASVHLTEATTTPPTSTTSREETTTLPKPATGRSELTRPNAASTGKLDRHPACTAKQPVVVLDPGHSGGPNFDSTAEVDGPKLLIGLGITFRPVDIDNSGIMAIDNAGAPGELVTMWRAALRIQQILRTDGYIVRLTKANVNENVGLLERVREAIDDHASIAVSLHYTGQVAFGEGNAHFGVTPQHIGLYRTNVTNGDTIRFTQAHIAAESQRDAEIIQRARAAAGDRVDVAPLDESFPKSRGLPAYGNISIVQVVDQQFPWIYNEDGDIGFDIHAYTTGIANGIERAVRIAPCLRPHA
jgi:N-acetylmuramoyl-L-alanine amidase